LPTSPDTDEMVTTLPFFCGIIFWITGLVTLKKPISDVSMTLRQSCAGHHGEEPVGDDAGVVHQHGDAFVACEQGRQRALAAASSATSNGHSSALPPPLRSAPGSRGRLLVALVVHGHVHAVGGKLDGDGAADAAAGARDQGQRGRLLFGLTWMVRSWRNSKCFQIVGPVGLDRSGEPQHATSSRTCPVEGQVVLAPWLMRTAADQRVPTGMVAAWLGLGNADQQPPMPALFSCRSRQPCKHRRGLRDELDQDQGLLRGRRGRWARCREPDHGVVRWTRSSTLDDLSTSRMGRRCGISARCRSLAASNGPH
jgi:hypothetical protein